VRKEMSRRYSWLASVCAFVAVAAAQQTASVFVTVAESQSRAQASAIEARLNAAGYQAQTVVSTTQADVASVHVGPFNSSADAESTAAKFRAAGYAAAHVGGASPATSKAASNDLEAKAMARLGTTSRPGVKASDLEAQARAKVGGPTAPAANGTALEAQALSNIGGAPPPEATGKELESVSVIQLQTNEEESAMRAEEARERARVEAEERQANSGSTALAILGVLSAGLGQISNQMAVDNAAQAARNAQAQAQVQAQVAANNARRAQMAEQARQANLRSQQQMQEKIAADRRAEALREQQEKAKADRIAAQQEADNLARDKAQRAQQAAASNSGDTAFLNRLKASGHAPANAVVVLLPSGQLIVHEGSANGPVVDTGGPPRYTPSTPVVATIAPVGGGSNSSGSGSGSSVTGGANGTSQPGRTGTGTCRGACVGIPPPSTTPGYTNAPIQNSSAPARSGGAGPVNQPRPVSVAANGSAGKATGACSPGPGNSYCQPRQDNSAAAAGNSGPLWSSLLPPAQPPGSVSVLANGQPPGPPLTTAQLTDLQGQLSFKPVAVQLPEGKWGSVDLVQTLPNGVEQSLMHMMTKWVQGPNRIATFAVSVTNYSSCLGYPYAVYAPDGGVDDKTWVGGVDLITYESWWPLSILEGGKSEQFGGTAWLDPRLGNVLMFRPQMASSYLGMCTAQ
jgi:hypothetical protein